MTRTYLDVALGFALCLVVAYSARWLCQALGVWPRRPRPSALARTVDDLPLERDLRR